MICYDKYFTQNQTPSEETWTSSHLLNRAPPPAGAPCKARAFAGQNCPTVLTHMPISFHHFVPTKLPLPAMIWSNVDRTKHYSPPLLLGSWHTLLFTYISLLLQSSLGLNQTKENSL